MANKKFLLAILAIALVLGMTVVGCSKGGKSSGEADGPGEPGTLTITGMPEQYFGMYILSAEKDLSSFATVSFAGMSPEAFGMQLTPNGNVYKIYSSKDWTVTGKRQVVLQASLKERDNPMDKNNPMFRTATVNFTNGGATVKFSSFKAVTK